jgi:hypothetical protein
MTPEVKIEINAKAMRAVTKQARRIKKARRALSALGVELSIKPTIPDIGKFVAIESIKRY